MRVELIYLKYKHSLPLAKGQQANPYMIYMVLIIKTCFQLNVFFKLDPQRRFNTDIILVVFTLRLLIFNSMYKTNKPN